MDSFLNTMIGSLVGAGLAFLSNICFNKHQNKNNEFARLSMLWINYCSLLNQLIYFKKEDTKKRYDGCSKLKKFIEAKAIYNNPSEEKLFTHIKTSELKVYADLTQLSFIINFEPDLLFLILTLDKSIKDFNVDSLDLNNKIEEIICSDSETPYEELLINQKYLFDYTRNVCGTLDGCIAFLDLSMRIISKIGIKKYGKKFRKLISHNIPDKYRSLIPGPEYLENKGFGTLDKKYNLNFKNI